MSRSHPVTSPLGDSIAYSGDAPAAASQRSWRDIALGGLLVLIVLVCYWPALHGGFVIDDGINITKPELRSIHGLWRIWTELGVTQQYYPFLYSAYWVEHRLWGDAVLGYHLVNVLQHAVAACLLVAVLRRLAVPGAWLAGFVFAVHPIAVESVAWIAEQKNTLSTALCLGSALAYLCFDRSRRPACYVLALVLFLAALASKTVVATLPAALLVVLWWQRGRLSVRRDVLPLAPWLMVGGAAGLSSAWVERRFVGASGDAFALSLVDRVLVASRAIWFYLEKLVWPAGLQFNYPRWPVGSHSAAAMGAAIATAFLAILVAWLARRWRGPAAALMLFVGLLAPMLGFLNIYWFLISFVADHFVYLPSSAIIAAFAAGLAMAARHASAVIRTIVAAASVALVATLGTMTWRHARIFGNYETLCRETLARNPGAWLMHHNLGVELAADPARLPEAMAHFRETIRLQPTFADAHFNLARAFQRSPDTLDAATEEYREAVRLSPADIDARFGLANTLANRGQLAEAIVEYRRVVEQRPNFADAHFYLARALTETSAPPSEAVVQYEIGLQLDPDNADAQNQLGRLLMQTPGQLPDAILHLSTARRLAPESLDANFNLSNALASAGRMGDAIAAFEATLRLKPDFVEAHYNLGCVFARTPGHAADARAHFETVLQLRPGFEPARQMLKQLPPQ